jgi:large subunit ribosomal protein L23
MRVPLHNLVFRMILSTGKNLGPNEFAFEVPQTMNKPQIRNYLESLYNVRVTSVDTAVIRGKVKRGNYGLYKRSDYKKAYVTVADPFPVEAVSAAAPQAPAL